MSKLRNNGIYTQEEYVGKTIEEGTKYANEGGFITRITETDGKPLMLTMEYRTNRLNFRVKGDKIIDVYGG
jgi:hypothetical protein